MTRALFLVQESNGFYQLQQVNDASQLFNQSKNFPLVFCLVMENGQGLEEAKTRLIKKATKEGIDLKKIRDFNLN